MPTKLVKNLVYMSYKGVKVYNTYRHDNADDVINEFHFTFGPYGGDPQAMDNFNGAFDVRDLTTFSGRRKASKVKAIREAMDSGELKPDE